VSSTAVGNRGVSPLKAAKKQSEDMDEAVQRVAERARAAGNARPKAEVKTRVDPSIKEERPRGAPDFRQRGLTKRLCARPSCNFEFVPTSPNQRYHSSDCRELAEKERRQRHADRVTGSPPQRAQDAAPVLPDPERQGETKPPETSEEVGWETVDRFLELLFTIAADRDEDPAVRISALELLDWFATLPLRD
jgi:hypothetical protein